MLAFCQITQMQLVSNYYTVVLHHAISRPYICKQSAVYLSESRVFFFFFFFFFFLIFCLKLWEWKPWLTRLRLGRYQSNVDVSRLLAGHRFLSTTRQSDVMNYSFTGSEVLTGFVRTRLVTFRLFSVCEYVHYFKQSFLFESIYILFKCFMFIFTVHGIQGQKITQSLFIILRCFIFMLFPIIWESTWQRAYAKSVGHSALIVYLLMGIFYPSRVLPLLWKEVSLRKTRLFKYIENFTTKKGKFSVKKFWYFSYSCSKHRSARRL